MTSAPMRTHVQHNGHMKMIARLLAGVVAALFTMVLSTSVAVACSCADATLAEQVESADVVARVIVEKTTVSTRDDGGKQVLLSVRPVHVWKGDVVSTFPLTTALEVTECGLGALAEGTDLLLFAEESEEKHSANWCGGTTSPDEATLAELIEVAGPGKGINPGVSDEPGAFVWPTITGIAALLIVAGAVAYWWILPRRRR